MQLCGYDDPFVSEYQSSVSVTDEYPATKTRNFFVNLESAEFLEPWFLNVCSGGFWVAG